MTAQFEEAFPQVPECISERLIKHYSEIKQNFALRKFEPSELNGGKFCEDVFRLLEWHTSPTNEFTPYGSKINNFRQSVLRFECQSDHTESVRFHIPDLLRSIYDIRNKRGVAHTEGEVSPNLMDATLVVSCADWIMAELVRLFHKVSLEEAQNMVDGLVTKKIPVVWKFGDKTRVLSPPDRPFRAKDKVLILLYSEASNVLTADKLRQMVEYNNPTDFKKKVLKQLHKDELVHFDSASGEVTLSPKGMRKVEDELYLEF